MVIDFNQWFRQPQESRFQTGQKSDLIPRVEKAVPVAMFHGAEMSSYLCYMYGNGIIIAINGW